MKVLMVLTSHDQLGNTGRKTGFWLEELAAPYYVFKDAGAQITLASPEGGRPGDVIRTKRGGPRIHHQPNGDGFGSLLARATVKGPLGGEISRDWKPEGLTIRLSIARDHVSA